MMIGEFHQKNNTGGLHNPSFFPLRTPIPALAMRYIVPGDLNFMTLNSYSPQLKANLLKSYLNKFGSQDIKEVIEAKVELDLISNSLIYSQPKDSL